MVDKRTLNELIDKRANQILNLAELALPDERKFKLLRTLILDELGQKGLRSDIAELLSQGGKGGI
mgnify:CR=1 FL=1